MKVGQEKAKNKNRHKQQIIKVGLAVSLLLLVLKFYAFLHTGSNAILSDALESIVNVVASAVAVYSIWLSSQPKDENHPYGHGKIEDVSAGFEGALIGMAGLFVIGKSIYNFVYPTEVQNLDIGLGITFIGGVVNFGMGWLIEYVGRQEKSSALVADGKHLKSDAYTSFGLLVGVAVIWWTGLDYLDNVVAIGFGLLLMWTGFRVVRKSVSVMTDEADQELIERFVCVLQDNRKPIWTDIHKMRVQKFGNEYHIDCHVTLPWYLIVKDAHHEVDAIEELVQEHFPKNEIELFIHVDPCQPEACAICAMPECPAREHPFRRQIEWTFENMTKNAQHYYAAAHRDLDQED